MTSGPLFSAVWVLASLLLLSSAAHAVSNSSRQPSSPSPSSRIAESNSPLLELKQGLVTDSEGYTSWNSSWLQARRAAVAGAAAPRPGGPLRRLLQTVVTSTDYSGWMGALSSVIGSQSLSQLVLPGTHDSGSYALTEDVAPDETDTYESELLTLTDELGLSYDFIKGWSLTQDCDLLTQAKRGMRYFDLRAGWDADTNQWRTFHFLWGKPVSVLLRDLVTFLHAHPSEAIVVEISHFIGSPSAANVSHLAHQVTSSFGSLLYPPTAGFADSIGAMVAKNQRAVVSMETCLPKPASIWCGNALINSYANSDQLSVMEPYNDQIVQAFNNGTDVISHSALYKVSWTLTPQDSTIEYSFLPGHPSTLYELAQEADTQLDSWIASSVVPYHYQLGQIFLLDFFDTTDVVLQVQKNIQRNA